MAMNKVGGENLYIGGIFGLKVEALEQAGITHVVSAVRLPAHLNIFESPKRMFIEVDDDEEENLLEHFTESNKFISNALKAGGVVLIHWFVNEFSRAGHYGLGSSGLFPTKFLPHGAQLMFFLSQSSLAGISRSATLLAAYLMASRRLAPNLALGIIKRSRSFVEPNPGFMDQLDLYHQMEYTEDVEDHPAYQRWMYLREVEMSNRAGRAPQRVHFRDAEAEVERIAGVKEETSGKIGEVQLRCKKCRSTLATSASITPHIPKPAQQPPGRPCAHHFVEPLLWMKPELSKGDIAGKLECPKCKSKVGSYAWQGLKCSCGDWVVPGISMARGKVDEVHVEPIKTEVVGPVE